MSPDALDHARRIFEGLPQFQALGLEVYLIEPGRSIMGVAQRDDLVGCPDGRLVHGGVVTTLLDSSCGVAAYAMLDPDTPLATLDMRIDYLKPADPDLRIYAEAEVYRMTRNVAFARAYAYQSDRHDRVAHCAASFMVGSVGFARGEARA